MRIAPVALIPAALAACAAPSGSGAGPVRPSAPAVVPVETGRDTPASTADEGAALVWFLGSDERPRTGWIELAGGQLLEHGWVSGLVVSDGRELWRWQTTPVKVATARCDLVDTGADFEPGDGAAERAVFLPVGDDERTQVVVEPAAATDANEWNATATPVASVGGAVFYEESIYDFSCGVHGNTAVFVREWDVTRGQSVPWTPTDYDSPACRSRAFERLRAASLDPDEGPEKLELVAVLPRFDGVGRLELLRIYTTFVCYACSDEWGSYRNGAEVPGPIAARLASHEQAPAVVVQYLDEHPGPPLRGWAPAPRRSAASAAVVALFSGGAAQPP